jgi:hypothetical protein
MFRTPLRFFKKNSKTVYKKVTKKLVKTVKRNCLLAAFLAVFAQSLLGSSACRRFGGVAVASRQIGGKSCEYECCWERKAGSTGTRATFKGEEFCRATRRTRSMNTEKDLSVYARLQLAPFIKEAVQAAVVARPSDTIEFIIQFLTKNKERLQQGMIAEAIEYVNAGGKMENGEDEVLLKQYASIKV